MGCHFVGVPDWRRFLKAATCAASGMQVNSQAGSNILSHPLPLQHAAARPGSPAGFCLWWTPGRQEPSCCAFVGSEHCLHQQGRTTQLTCLQASMCGSIFSSKPSRESQYKADEQETWHSSQARSQGEPTPETGQAVPRLPVPPASTQTGRKESCGASHRQLCPQQKGNSKEDIHGAETYVSLAGSGPRRKRVVCWSQHNVSQETRH